MSIFNICISNFITIVIFKYYNAFFFKQRVSKYKLYLIMAFFVISQVFINLYSIVNLNIILSIVCYFLFAVFCFKGSFVSKFILTISYLIIGIVCELTSSIILQLVLQTTYLNITTTDFSFFLGVVGSNTLLIFFINLIFRFVEINRLAFTSKNVWWIIILPITSVLLIVNLYDYAKINTHNLIILICIVFLLLSNLITFNMFYKILLANALEHENKLLKEKELTDKLSYKMVNEKYYYSRSLIHDIKKHIGMLTAYTEIEDYDSLKNYLMTFNQEITIQELGNTLTNQKVLNLILSYNLAKINNNGINLRLDVDVEDTDTSQINDLDLNIIFANTIENAIDSAKDTEDKLLKIKLNKVNENIIFKVINSCDQVIQNNDTFQTKKEDKEIHGFGLNNIDRVAKKYSGQATFNYDEGHKLFITTVIIKVS